MGSLFPLKITKPKPIMLFVVVVSEIKTKRIVGNEVILLNMYLF